MTIPTFLALLTLLVGVPINLYVVRRLRRLSRQSNNPVLSERKVTAYAVLLTVSVFAVIFLNNDLPVPALDLATTKIITRSIVLALAIIPSSYWLWLYPPKWLRRLRHIQPPAKPKKS